MSDHIDYDELDKAVNEAIKSRQAARPVRRPAAKTVVKTTTPKAPRPHGQYIDFVAKRPTVKRSVARPVTKPTITQPVARGPQPAIRRAIVRPTTPRPAIKPAAQPTARTARPLAKTPTVKAPAAQRPVVKTAPRPTVSRPQPKPNTVVRPAMPSPAAVTAAKAATATAAPTPAAPKDEVKAPNANNYSLGGRSPFMIDAKVDKRPLGTNIPETTARTLLSTKNTYSQKDPSATTKRRKANKHIITESPKKHSGWLWTLIVLLVIAGGAGLGYLAYLIVFAN